MLQTDNPRENHFQVVSAPTISPNSCATLGEFAFAASRPLPRPRGLLSGAELRAGYLVENEALDAIYNRTLAAMLLIMISPIFLVICVLMKLTTPGPVLYRGARLGRGRKVFHMLKFRTLATEAARLTRDRTLPRHNLCETPLGTYLRKSRLDELPQLLNILRGEMVFYGPRPIRPEVEDHYMSAAPSYALRFVVRPGLIGLAQARLTHETPKAARARLTAMCCRAPVNYPRQTVFITWIGLCVLWRTLTAIGDALGDLASPIHGHKWLRSGFSRPSASRIEIITDNETRVAVLSGISDEIVQFVSPRRLAPRRYAAELVRQRRRHRIARVPVTINLQIVTPVGVGQPGVAHYAAYRVNSDYSRYMIERYFLRSAVVPS